MTKKEILQRFTNKIVNNAVMNIIEIEEDPEEIKNYLFGYIDALYDTKIVDYDTALDLCNYVVLKIADAIKTKFRNRRKGKEVF